VDAHIYTLLATKSAFKLELSGIRVTRRSCYALVKRNYKLKGNKQSVYSQFCTIVETELRNRS
jgi:hypothetical protein